MSNVGKPSYFDNPVVKRRLRRDARQPLPVGQLSDADARALAMMVHPSEDVGSQVANFKNRNCLRDFLVRPRSFQALEAAGHNVADLWKKLKEPDSGSDSSWIWDKVLKKWVSVQHANQPSVASQPLLEPAPVVDWPSASSSSSSRPPAPAAAALAAASSSSEHACVVVAERSLTPYEQAIRDSIRDYPIVQLPWGNQFVTQGRSEPESEPPMDAGAWGPGAWNRNGDRWSQEGSRRNR